MKGNPIYLCYKKIYYLLSRFTHILYNYFSEKVIPKIKKYIPVLKPDSNIRLFFDFIFLVTLIILIIILPIYINFKKKEYIFKYDGPLLPLYTFI